MNMLAMSPLVSVRCRRILLRLWGARVRHASISPDCYFGGSNISIGYGTRLNRGVYIDNNARVEIGSWCNLAMEAMIVTSSHHVGPPAHRAGANDDRPVTIGDGCWIGARAVILPGVKVGDGCFVLAGAVVAEDCAPNGVYAGLPARRVRDLPLDGAPNRSNYR
jgi:maltose O-acetyltransferase